MAKKKALVKSGCKCIESVQSQLKSRGVHLVRHLQMDLEAGEGRLSPPSLVVERSAGSKVKLPTVFCSYCPFCGTKY